jgi:hypothetical protein
VKNYLLRDIPPATWEACLQRAADDGVSIADVMRLLLKAYAAKRIHIVATERP